MILPLTFLIPRQPNRAGGSLLIRPESIDGEPAFSVSGNFDWVSPNHDMFVSGFGQMDFTDPVNVDGDGFSEIAKRDMVSFGVRSTASPPTSWATRIQ